MTTRKSGSDASALLAFCHIEKAAGTSLIHILRRVFFLRYAAVRPMHSRDEQYLTARDLKTIKKLNPCLRCVGGHSVVPHGDLVEGPQRLRFITQMRDPVARAASQFRYWVNRMNLETDLAGFLEHPVSQNFQVKKIAGCEDLDLAKENMRRHFLLAGTVERFDEFVVLLADKLEMPLQLFTYRLQNVDTVRRPLEIPDRVLDRLRERNQLDQQLYDWIDRELLPDYIGAYSGDFSADLKLFRNLQLASGSVIKPIIDSLFRNVYWKPVSGIIRVSNGLPYRGSYATE